MMQIAWYRPLLVGLFGVFALLTGCGSDSSAPPISQQAARDQDVLEQAAASMLDECRERGRVEPTNVMVAAVKIIDDRPNERLSGEATPLSIAHQIIADVKACGTLDAEFVEMMFTPGTGETSFEQERRERSELLAGDIKSEQPLLEEICTEISQRGAAAAEREFIDNTPYTELALARRAFPSILSACE